MSGHEHDPAPDANAEPVSERASLASRPTLMPVDVAIGVKTHHNSTVPRETMQNNKITGGRHELDQIAYDSKRSSDEIRDEVESLWDQLQKPGALRDAADAQGIDLDELGGKQLKEVISFQDEGAGISPETVAIVVAFAPLFVKIASDLWEHIFLPRIIERWGDTAMKKRDP